MRNIRGEHNYLMRMFVFKEWKQIFKEGTFLIKIHIFKNTSTYPEITIILWMFTRVLPLV